MTPEQAVNSIAHELDGLDERIKAAKAHMDYIRHSIAEARVLIASLAIRPQEQAMSLAEAIEKATKIYDHAVSKSNADFHYDRKHRKTTCVIRVKPTRQGGLATYAVGRAWCSKDDQFIYAVGQAIAYHRALGREVPEWLLHIPNE
jgi:hypothetical protein